MRFDDGTLGGGPLLDAYPVSPAKSSSVLQFSVTHCFDFDESWYKFQFLDMNVYYHYG